MQYTAEKPSDPITLYVYTGKDADFMLYEDEGVNHNYEKDAFANIPLRYGEHAKNLNIRPRRCTLPGMVARCSFWVVCVRKD